MFFGLALKSGRKFFTEQADTADSETEQRNGRGTVRHGDVRNGESERIRSFQLRVARNDRVLSAKIPEDGGVIVTRRLDDAGAGDVDESRGAGITALAGDGRPGQVKRKTAHRPKR